MNKSIRREIFIRLREANQNPTTELNYRNPFELLIAVILSAQATDVSVNKATGALFEEAPTPQAMVQLGEDGIIPFIRHIGLFRSKAKNIVECCRVLCEKYQGEVPQVRDELEDLAGVGRKTANVVLNTAFGQPTLAVDTHIFRVANRIGIARGKTVREVEDKLMKTIEKEFILNAHHWLILHGRYTCTARKPKCNQCVIYDCCEYKDKTDC